MAHSEPKILVVDGTRAMRMTLSVIIEDQGYDVTQVEDGYQAIDAAGETSFDLIFIGIKMPGLNGVHTFREIKKISPASAVVMMTGFAAEELLKEALDEGAFAIIYKPFQIERIISLLESVLKTVVVLIVDDRSSDRKILGEILRDRGFRVNEAADGEEAVGMVRHNGYDIIFMDIKLPGADGVSTFQEIKSVDPDAKVIFMTGFALEESARQAIEAGAYPIVYKPFGVENTLDLVDQLVPEKSR